MFVVNKIFFFFRKEISTSIQQRCIELIKSHSKVKRLFLKLQNKRLQKIY